MVHAGLGTGRYVGQAFGEVWGRLFVAGQVGRWLTGTAPGHADLLAAPHGQSFWPVDPVLQLVLVPAVSVLGEATGWAVTLGVLAGVAGLGGYVLARVLGASPVVALGAGLLVQLDPFWLRHAAEGVTEVLALGPVALAAAAAVAAVNTGRWWAWAAYAAAVAVVAGTSPYYGAFGALVLVATAPLWPRPRWRRVLGLIGATAVVGMVFLVPFVLTESGPGGRLSGAWTGGYRLEPEPLVVIGRGGELAPVGQGRGVPFGPLGNNGLSWLHQALVQWPGGFAVTGVLVAGLVPSRSRRIAAVGLLVLALGPAWEVVGRWIGVLGATSPLAALLGLLPGTSLLGNAHRLAVIPIVGAAACLGAVGPRWPRAVAVVVPIAALVAAWVETPPLSLPAVANPLPEELSAVVGPTVTWPNGDPTAWNPDRYPKEALWLAVHHGGAQAYDYGRGGIPSDEGLLVRLSQVARVPVGRTAARRHVDRSDEAILHEVRAAGMRTVLVLNRGLEPAARRAVDGWLLDHVGSALVLGEAASVWSLDPGRTGRQDADRESELAPEPGPPDPTRSVDAP